MRAAYEEHLGYSLKRFSIMTRKEKIEWRDQMATILRQILDKCPVSDEFVHCGSDTEFFGDSCNFVLLRHEILELASTLERINAYSKMLEK